MTLAFSMLHCVLFPSLLFRTKKTVCWLTLWTFGHSRNHHEKHQKCSPATATFSFATTTTFSFATTTTKASKATPFSLLYTTMATTAADVLQLVRFEERAAEVELKLPAVLAVAKDEPLARRNQAKRQLYLESELIRVELEEQMNLAGIEPQFVTSPEMQAANKRLDAIRQQLCLDVLPATRSQLEQAYSLVRFVTFALLLVGWFSALTFAIPLRFAGPFLRSLGWKKNYLPIDILSVRVCLCVWLVYVNCSGAGLTSGGCTLVGDGVLDLPRSWHRDAH